MKLYLDDERATPNGYTRCYTPKDVILYLVNNRNIDEVSLDHDLGSDEFIGTGYDVLLWIEERVFTEGYIPPKIKVHSANVSARYKMELAIKRIEKFLKENKK